MAKKANKNNYPLLIKNYGLFWDKDEVHWGTPKNSGTLMGVHSREKLGGHVNFREQIGIYALYDSAFNLVYVGQSGTGKDTLLKRLNTHQTDHLSERWKLFSWFGLRYVKINNSLADRAEITPASNSTLLHTLEAICIAVAEPKLNLRGGNFLAKCEQYYQIGKNHKSLTSKNDQLVEVLTETILDLKKDIKKTLSEQTAYIKERIHKKRGPKAKK